jgi:hypothetical protein
MEAAPFEEVRAAVVLFDELFGADTAAAALADATGRRIDLGRVDLGRADHRQALHRWLNSWGCRIRYPRPGEADPFDDGVAAWWRRRGAALRRVREPLAELSDAHLDAIAAAYGDLSAVPIALTTRGVGRTMGPTASAKALYALLPHTVMPWDQTIATRLHGGRDTDAFARHLRLGRSWAARLLDATGWDERRLTAELGQPGASLARLLDEFCYVRYTLGR